MYLDQCNVETRLYKLCTWATKYATVSLGVLKAKREFVQCVEMQNLKTIAEAYLGQVCDADVAYFHDSELKQFNVENLSHSVSAAKSPSPLSRASSDNIIEIDDSHAESDEDSDDDSDADDWDPDIDASVGEDEFDDEELDWDMDNIPIVDLLQELKDKGVLSPKELDDLQQAVRRIKDGLSPRATTPKSRNARKRKQKTYSAKVNSGRKPLEKPPSNNAFLRFIRKNQAQCS